MREGSSQPQNHHALLLLSYEPGGETGDLAAPPGYKMEAFILDGGNLQNIVGLNLRHKVKEACYEK